MAKTMKIHPLCKMFSTIAPLSKDKRQELFDDIREKGIIVPILVNKKKDTILDGYTRWGIAYDLKIQDATLKGAEVFRGKDEDIAKEILSRNLHRRHLSDDQRAAIVSQFRGPELEKEAKDRMQHKDNGNGKGASGSFKKGPAVKQLATEAGVSQHKMQQVEKVRKAGKLEEVISGKTKAAKVAKSVPAKKKPRKEVPFDDQVYAKWTRFINAFAPPQRRRVMELVVGWIGTGAKKK